MNEGPARVLQALRSTDGDPRSGEALKTLLDVSRAQIWKHVETLRKLGYEIEGEPGGGYRLRGVPDRLYPEEVQAGLATRWLGRQIDYLEETDSTNRVAQDWARAGGEHGSTVIAEGQSAGRGRLGRSFFSPAGLNLYTSIVLRPKLHVAEAPTLILTAAVATAEAVAESVGDDAAVTIKWPNDVQLGGLKTSGILMEMSAEATQVGFAVLGIGVNLNIAPDTFPEEFRTRATSLAAFCGRPVDRLAFTRRLFERLEDALEAHARSGFAGLRERFDARFRMRGQAVRIDEQDGSALHGVVRDVAPDGALELEVAGGERRRVIAGDVTIAKEEARA